MEASGTLRVLRSMWRAALSGPDSYWPSCSATTDRAYGERRYAREMAQVTEDWTTRAACRGLDPDLFFPEQGEPATYALAVCRSCDVTAECLATALENHERMGIWGGTTGQQRRDMVQCARSAS